MNSNKRRGFKKIASLLAVILLGLSQDLPAGERGRSNALAKSSVQPISASALSEKMRQRNEGKAFFALVDLRNEVDYMKGHLPGAVNLPAARHIFSLGLVSQKDRGLVFYGYSRNDKAAMNTPMWAAKQGVSEVYLLDGGFKGWTGEIEK